jgi:FHS family L-fucose permease-like MFS transporter
LAIASAVALLLCLVVTQRGGLVASLFGEMSAGGIAGWAAIAVGFFNSIMFPTIFTLTLERSNAPTPSTSGLLCMAIVGGAILPVLTGYAADQIGIALAFFVPCVSYLCILIFAIAGARVSATIANSPISA